ncbi:hypothetical protein Vadar_029199 [Vaccinium darrowii]|uniref:Uncharacterized protein n=1 Tax=Vaccinium darrowii TaxID=229202 RepID=A0ACB7YZD7_9ERIC|nr:hypothetical protein Vadar_029199 [Vaccinium darrowii]
MELIRNEKSRYVTFQKRKKGMKKKAYELQTLCGVEVCLIIYGPITDERPNTSEAEIWPENPATIHDHLIESYKNQPSEERAKRTLTSSDIFMDRTQKIEESLVKLRKKNGEAMYSTWDDRYSNLSYQQLREFDALLEGKLQDVKARIALMKGSSHTQTTQNPSCFVQDLFGTRNMQWEDVHEQQPISMLNPRFDYGVPIHYPFNPEIQQGIQIDANSMENSIMMMPMNYGNQYGTTASQLGGASSSKFMCNLPFERPIYGYDPSMSGMLDNPLPLGYCINPKMETMSPYLQYLKMVSDLSLVDKYYCKGSEFQAKNQN